MKLEIENVSLSIEDTLILENLSLNVDEHEIISLIGPSASGKSSLLRIIAGFENVDSGKVKLSGLVVDDRSRIVQPQNRNVGIIFQDLALFPHLTVRENICFGLSAMSNNKQSDRAEKLEEILNIVDIKDRYPDQISGGQQQRVAIARALLNMPEIIIADEPTGNLDPQTSLEIMEVFQKLHQQGMTVLMATHDYNMIVKFPGKILRCDEGTVYEVVQKKER